MYPERLVWYMCGFGKENAETCIFGFSKRRNTKYCLSVTTVFSFVRGREENAV